MGRNRKPKAVAERDGSFDKHPERRANYENEPKPAGPLGPPPASFDPESYTGSRLLAIWNEIVAQAPPGVLTGSDRLHVEMTCRMIHRVRTGTAKSGDFNSIRDFLGKMAMNPADRPKVQINAGGGVAVPSKADAATEQNTFAQIAEEVRQESRQSRPN